MKRRGKIITVIIAAFLLASVYSCRDSENETATVQVDYDPAEAAAPYVDGLPEMTDADKDYVVEMGYRDCDHMVAAIIGQDTGLYEALGLNVEITKTGQVSVGVAAGEFDAAYDSYTASISSYNEGADVITLVGSHLGGARYFVVRDDIESLGEIKRLTVSEDSMANEEWLRFAQELGMDSDYRAYEGASMAQPDALVALKADQIDGIFVCDPYASIAEHEGFGKIINVSWGSQSEELGLGWGQCCTEIYNHTFVNEHPALAARLALAHCLATQYMYTHPYNAGMMFADTFGTDPAVGLRTMYLKTNAEGRTMNWEISPENISNLYDYQTHWNLAETDKTQVTRGTVEEFFDMSFLEMCGMESFSDFLETSGVAENFPEGMAYADWLKKAEEIDGIDSSGTVGKTVEKWMAGEFVTELTAANAA